MKRPAMIACALLACAAQLALAAQPAPSFAVAPTSGRAPLPVTVTWNVPNGTNCQGGGAWQGAKAASGSETLTLTASATFTLACTVPGPLGPQTATATWTPATQNTDGSAYTNPKGYFIYFDRENPPITRTALIPHGQTSQTFPGLQPGWTVYFQITSVNANDVESARTGVVPLGVVGTPTQVSYTPAALAVDVQPALPLIPRPPVLTLTLQ